MQLRSGKIINTRQSNNVEDFQSEIICQWTINNNFSITNMLKNIVNHREIIDNDENLSVNEMREEKIRIFREVYYLINYYDLQNNLYFNYLMILFKKKAIGTIVDINELLSRKNDYDPSQCCVDSAFELHTELTTFLLCK